MAEEHPLVQLARRAIESYVREGVVIRPPKELTEEMKRRAGTFVSLHRHGQLRGCIGTIEPVRANVAEEVIANAISAATRDPRFSPLRPDELEDLEISVDVLSEPEPISSLAELDPKVYGVIVESGRRRGLLLPDLEGVDTPEQQVAIALRKAWIDPTEPYRMYRFRVERYH
ncbi:MAG: AmmeMemoRadiSam system protein A [Anaerolineae bacterium]|nr:AmmeMemoRadiSam system protein A [Anaerolineae bacterium]